MKFVLLCFPRSGSTLLISALGAIPGVRQGMEVFNPELGGDADWVDWRKAALADLYGPEVSYLDERGYLDEGRFNLALLTERFFAEFDGTKVMYDQLGLDSPVWDALTAMPDLRVIVLRRNVVEAALSFARALNTNIWHVASTDEVPPSPTLDVDVDFVRWFYDHFCAREQLVTSKFDSSQMLEVSYEELVTDWAETLDRLQTWLGLEAKPVPKMFRKRTDGKVTETVRNFDDLAAHYADHPVLADHFNEVLSSPLKHVDDVDDVDEVRSGMTSEQVLSLILPERVAYGFGGHLVDLDGRDYIDLVSAWGTNILGYGHKKVAAAIATQAANYTNLGMAGPEYATLRNLLLEHVPCAEEILLVKNGSDATAAAVRLARLVTGRTRVLHHGYHGVQDWYMASNGCPGVPTSIGDDILTLRTLTIESVREVFRLHPKQIACLIVDPLKWPIAEASEIQLISELVRDEGALLIFDEVVSGFRVALGGMQEVWGVTPDLACFGKAIANGSPLSALVGPQRLMRHVHSINYSLTFGLEALSIVAAIETIGEIIDQDVCGELARKGRYLKDAYSEMCAERSIDSELAGHDVRPELVFRAADGLSAEMLHFIAIQELAKQKICTYGVFSLSFAHHQRDLDAVVVGLGRTLDAVSLAISQARSLGNKRKVDAPSVSDPIPVDPYSGDTILSYTPDELESVVRLLTFDEVSERFGNDPWLHNYVLSVWEYVNGKTQLTSLPWNLTLGITTTRNAKCTFCSVPMRRAKDRALPDDLESIPHLERLLRFSRLLLITGGEPTIHPRFATMLGRLKELLDPRCYVTMITHGSRLDRFSAELDSLNVNYVVSLNAATPATHHKLMQLGENALPQIIESIRRVIANGRIVDLSLVVVHDNLEEIPAFLELAEDLGVHGVYLRTLIPGDYYAAMFPEEEKFLSLPAWSHPDIEYWKERASDAIAKTTVQVYGDPGQWGIRLQSAALPANTDRATLVASVREDPPIAMTKGDPLSSDSTHDDWRTPVENAYQRSAPFACSYPWYALKILDTSKRIYPCSFIHHIMGFDDVGLHGSNNFFELWNSPAMLHLRRTLHEGPLLPECVTCPSQMGGQGQCQSDHDDESHHGASNPVTVALTVR